VAESYPDPLPAGSNPTDKPLLSITCTIRTIRARSGRSTRNAAQLPLGSQDFFSRAEVQGDCWLWRGPKRGRYGSVGETGYAHRRAYERFIGPIPPGLYVLHRCDTPLCINPSHLFLGTQQDNLDDAKAKGRLRRVAAGAES